MAAYTRTIILLIIQQHFLESDQIHYKCVAEGEDVTLSCEKGRPEQKQCDLTTWTFQRRDLVTYGLLNSNSNRVNLTDDCSLRIKDVQAQEAGEYKCRQSDRSGQSFPLDTLVSLSIVSMTEVTDTLETAKLNCSVATDRRCVQVPLNWLVGGAPVTDHPGLTVKTSGCWTSVEGPTSFLNNFPERKFTCNVKCDGKKIQFHFRKGEPEDSTVKTLTTTKTWVKNSEDKCKKESTTQEESREDARNERDERGDEADDRAGGGSKGWWWAVVAVAVVSCVTAVAFVTWRRVKAKRQDSSGAPPVEDGVFYASINFDKSHKKTVIRASEEAVTYSSVRIPPQDPAQLHPSANRRTDK